MSRGFAETGFMAKPGSHRHGHRKGKRLQDPTILDAARKRWRKAKIADPASWGILPKAPPKG